MAMWAAAADVLVPGVSLWSSVVDVVGYVSFLVFPPALWPILLQL